MGTLLPHYLLLFTVMEGPGSAHSGGTDQYGCHAGSRPYHCHNGGYSSSTGSGNPAAAISDLLTLLREREQAEAEARRAADPCSPESTYRRNEHANAAYAKWMQRGSFEGDDAAWRSAHERFLNQYTTEQIVCNPAHGYGERPSEPPILLEIRRVLAEHQSPGPRNQDQGSSEDRAVHGMEAEPPKVAILRRAARAGAKLSVDLPRQASYQPASWTAEGATPPDVQTLFQVGVPAALGGQTLAVFREDEHLYVYFAKIPEFVTTRLVHPAVPDWLPVGRLPIASGCRPWPNTRSIPEYYGNLDDSPPRLDSLVEHTTSIAEQYCSETLASLYTRESQKRFEAEQLVVHPHQSLALAVSSEVDAIIELERRTKRFKVDQELLRTEMCGNRYCVGLRFFASGSSVVAAEANWGPQDYDSAKHILVATECSRTSDLVWATCPTGGMNHECIRAGAVALRDSLETHCRTVLHRIEVGSYADVSLSP